jgi:hypothetical protein
MIMNKKSNINDKFVYNHIKYHTHTTMLNIIILEIFNNYEKLKELNENFKILENDNNDTIRLLNYIKK